MIRLRIAAVGNLKEKYWREAFAEYEKRISRFASLSVKVVAEKRTKEEEGKELLSVLSGKAVLCDIGGENLSSTEIASFLQDCLNRGQSEITFVIGGSTGVSEEVKAFCKKKISFGRATYPHQMMRVILAEQLYRALTIMNNVTYHK